MKAADDCCGEIVEQVGDACIKWVARKEAGGSNPAHRHPNCEEVLHVLTGDVEHYVEGSPLVRLAAGQTAIIPRNARHRARNVGSTEAMWVVSFSSASRETIFCKDEPDAHLLHLCEFFQVPRVTQISWGHAVNSKAELARCIENGTQFFEADIITRARDGVPIMAHPPATDSDLTFDEWIERVATARRGIKLDMKEASVLQPVMKKLLRMVVEKRLDPSVPIWLNADVVHISGPTRITAPELIAAATELQLLHPHTAISTGFTISPDHGEYTAAKRDEMEQLTSSFAGHVTIPINASILCRPGAWSAVRPFLDRPNYSITLYGKVTKQEMEFLEKNVLGPKVFPDIQQDL